MVKEQYLRTCGAVWTTWGVSENSPYAITPHAPVLRIPHSLLVFTKGDWVPLSKGSGLRI